MIENLNSFISWIVYSGGALLIASWVLDKIPAFVKAASQTKYIINLAVAVILAAGFYAVIVYVPAGVLAALDPWFKIVAGVVVVYSGQQAVHQATKADPAAPVDPLLIGK